MTRRIGTAEGLSGVLQGSYLRTRYGAYRLTTVFFFLSRSLVKIQSLWPQTAKLESQLFAEEAASSERVGGRRAIMQPKVLVSETT